MGGVVSAVCFGMPEAFFFLSFGFARPASGPVAKPLEKPRILRSAASTSLRGASPKVVELRQSPAPYKRLRLVAMRYARARTMPRGVPELVNDDDDDADDDEVRE